MFEPLPAPRRRPLFAVSAAAHAALAAALVVPPLLATPEPPEPDGFVRIETVPRLAGDDPVRIPVESLGGAREGGYGARAASASRAGARTPLSQPAGIGSVLPDPTGEPESPFTLEESGESSVPSRSGGGWREGAAEDGEGGCEGCKVISASAPGVSPPVAIETISPPYPELARHARVEGVVVLEAIIGSDGAVRDVRVLRGASPLLDPAAVEAVRRWRYRAATVGARPVSVFLQVVITFSLRNL